MHTLLYLIVELNDELIAEHESEKECVEFIADHVMMNMVEQGEGFDWYGVDDTVPYETIKREILASIDECITFQTERIKKLRDCMSHYTDKELASGTGNVTEWQFTYLCNRIGQYAGSDIPVYLVDEYGTYDGISTKGSLDFMLDGKNNLWVATVDAHS